MGKKVKAKNVRKTQQRERPATSSDAGSGDAASQDASYSMEEAAVSVSGREQCGHYSHDSAHLDKVLLEILSSKHYASCEHCREDAPRKKGGKEKGGKQQQKKGGGSKGSAKAQSKVEKSDMWVCLDCGRQFCGGEGADIKPYGHARRHAKQDRHWWAAKYDDPTVAYCLSCEKEVPVEMPELKTVVAVTVDDTMVGAEDSNASGLANCHGNVIKGLPNLGNTCFFNAVMQNLLALDGLRRRMLGSDVPTGPLSMSLKKLFVDTSASNDTGGTLSPKNLFSSICSKYPQFRGYQMQDSHELLRCFLDGLRTEETEAWKLAEDASDAGVPTIIDSIFAGQLSSTVSSTECSHSSVKHDQFLDLSLPVPSRRPPAKSVASPPAKRTKQSIRDRNKSRRYGKIPARASPTVEENNEEKIQTVAECKDSQTPGSESGQAVSEKEHEPSECSESCASVSNQEPKVTSNVENDMSWLDYVADASETKSEILDSADSIEAGQIEESKHAILDSFHPQDDALSKEQNFGSEHSGENAVDVATSLQPVILLPYDECGSIAKEFNGTEENSQTEYAEPPPVVSPVTQDNTQPASGGDVEQDEFVGFGDIFNEPEVTSEVNKGTGKVEDIDVVAWSSNSADDEVDDSNAPVSVEGCLALYTEPELLSEPWHCEHCTKAARANTNEAKNGIELMESASERKGNEEMMADGVERQDGEKLVMNCSKKEDIDQIMTMDGCSDNVHPDMQFTEGEYADPALAELEQTTNASCSATNTVKPECGGIPREEVISSLPSDAERILPSVKDNEDANTRNQDRRKRMKMVGHVRFKEMLDIRPFMDPRSKENDSTMYRLVGVVEHMGSMTGGHYIAYVRASKIGGRQQQRGASKSWFYASDGHLLQVGTIRGPSHVASVIDVPGCEIDLKQELEADAHQPIRRALRCRTKRTQAGYRPSETA
ncbi:hypothetical protein QOZ80_6AG0540750 [Eleusine coracana subsp. coracana]|nr:hypothetical protein QOZ80_6AG0540750 [Eleusine coracana subsp. coracana]